MENTQALPHERVWNYSVEPFHLEARNDFKCLFCKDSDGKPGEMVVSHGQVFNFDLELHGDYEGKKKSHAIDTWLYCWDCKWTVVHGVAIPKNIYDEFAVMVSQMPELDEKGEPMEGTEKKRPAEIPDGMSMTVIPHDLRKEERRPPEQRWAPVHHKVGMEPTFPMTCKMCGYEGTMFLRHSKMHLVKRDVEAKRWKIPFTKGKELRLFKPLSNPSKVPAFRISYKCPECDWLATFVVPDEMEHFETILTLREGQVLYYPPLEDWKSEDELVKHKLETLGYV